MKRSSVGQSDASPKKRKGSPIDASIVARAPKKRHADDVGELGPSDEENLPERISQPKTKAAPVVKEEPQPECTIEPRHAIPANAPGGSQCPILVSESESNANDSDQLSDSDMYAVPDDADNGGGSDLSTSTEELSGPEDNAGKNPNPAVQEEEVIASAVQSTPASATPLAHAKQQVPASSTPTEKKKRPHLIPNGTPSRSPQKFPFRDLGKAPRRSFQRHPRTPSLKWKSSPASAAVPPHSQPKATVQPRPRLLSAPQPTSQPSRMSSTARVEDMLGTATDIEGDQTQPTKSPRITSSRDTSPAPSLSLSPSIASSHSQSSSDNPASSPDEASQHSSPSQFPAQSPPVLKAQGTPERKAPPPRQPPPLSQAPLSCSPTTSKKRRRAERHAEYWHLDGSVIIQIHTTMFRLHRSRLAQQSPYFSNIFEGGDAIVVDGEENEEMGATNLGYIENTPAYEISGVSVTDFECLLEALDGGIMYVFHLPPFEKVASILRASRKLSFGTLDEFASYTLRKMWPSDLSKLTSDQIPHASETIVLARTCRMPELLKRAFYELIRTGGLGQEIVDDGADEDATFFDDEEDELRKFSHRDLVRLISLREKLHLAWYLAADSPPGLLDYPCPLLAPENPAPLPGQDQQQPIAPADDLPPILSLEQSAAREKCQAAHKEFSSHWHSKVKASMLFENCMYDPVCGIERLSNLDWESIGFCGGCVQSWRTSWARQREKLWSNVGLWLGLPDDEEQ